MARKNVADAAKAKAEKQKKIVIGLGVVLALAMAYAVHTMMAMNKSDAASKPQVAADTTASVTPAPAAATPSALPAAPTLGARGSGRVGHGRALHEPRECGAAAGRLGPAAVVLAFREQGSVPFERPQLDRRRRHVLGWFVRWRHDEQAAEDAARTADRTADLRRHLGERRQRVGDLGRELPRGEPAVPARVACPHRARESPSSAAPTRTARRR